MKADELFVNRGKKKGMFFKAVMIAVILIMIAQPVLAAGPSRMVFPPGSKPYGKTYNQWSGEWWKYVFQFPLETNPLNDPTGVNCGVDQSGPVFFLVGSTGGSATRDNCVVPVGKALFFPLLNFVCAVPEDGATFEDIKALCSMVTDYIDALDVTVDGVPVKNLWNYRFASPSFSFTGAVDNPWDTSCGTPGTCYEGYHETGFSDGYLVMLPPMPPGEHSIHFGGHFNYPDWGWEFNIDVTYNLTVSNPG